MNTKIKNLEKIKNLKVVKVTKTDYTLDNGDVYEHTFDIDESITPEEFQKLLDNSVNTVIGIIKKKINDW